MEGTIIIGTLCVGVDGCGLWESMCFLPTLQVSVLVMCHTRELAFQISKEYERFSKYMPSVKVSLLRCCVWVMLASAPAQVAFIKLKVSGNLCS